MRLFCLVWKCCPTLFSYLWPAILVSDTADTHYPRAFCLRVHGMISDPFITLIIFKDRVMPRRQPAIILFQDQTAVGTVGFSQPYKGTGGMVCSCYQHRIAGIISAAVITGIVEVIFPIMYAYPGAFYQVTVLAFLFGP